MLQYRLLLQGLQVVQYLVVDDCASKVGNAAAGWQCTCALLQQQSSKCHQQRHELHLFILMVTQHQIGL
jgi:hypothetical protein